MLHDVPKICITDKYIVSFLICYLLQKCGPLTEGMLTEITGEDDMVGYFDLIEGIGVAEKKKMLSATVNEGVKTYKITESGRYLSEEFINKIPLSIREKTEKSGMALAKDAELRKSYDWKIVQLEKGYQFVFIFKNELGGADFLDISLYAPSYERAVEMQERFLRHPDEITQQAMILFTTDNFLL